jgi:hypothetical protein
MALVMTGRRFIGYPMSTLTFYIVRQVESLVWHSDTGKRAHPVSIFSSAVAATVLLMT